MRAVLAPMMLADERTHEDSNDNREERQTDDCLSGDHLSDCTCGDNLHHPVIAPASPRMGIR